MKSKATPSVVIDGITYIPARDVLANEDAIARGLLVHFWGNCTDEQLAEFKADSEIRVSVNDSGNGPTLDKFWTT